MEVEKGNEVIAVEDVDAGCELPRNVEVPHLLSNDRTVLRLDETVVIAVSGSALGLPDVQLLQKTRDGVVDVLGPVVRVKVFDAEREEKERDHQHLFEDGFRDLFDGNHDLPLRHLVDEVDVVNALLLAQITLVDGVDSDETGHAVRSRFASLPNGHLGGFRLLDGDRSDGVTLGPPKPVHRRTRDVLQSDESSITGSELVGTELGCKIAAQSADGIVDHREELAVLRRVETRETVARLLDERRIARPVPADVPGQLRIGVAGDRPEKLSQQTLLFSCQPVVPEMEQPASKPPCFFLAGKVLFEREHIGCMHEGFDLIEGLELGGVEHRHHVESMFP